MTQPASGVSACFPAFNDAGSIAWVARRAEEALRPSGREFEILILDDGSTDETAAVLRRLAAEIPELRMLRHPENRGYGATLRNLFTAARFPLVVYTDGDGQFDPSGAHSAAGRSLTGSPARQWFSAGAGRRTPPPTAGSPLPLDDRGDVRPAGAPGLGLRFPAVPPRSAR